MNLLGDRGDQGTPGYTTAGYHPVRLVNLEDEENTVILTRTEYAELIRHDERLELMTALATEGCLNEKALVLLLTVDHPSVKNDIRYHKEGVVR